MGLVPDSWFQTGLLAAVMANSWGAKKTPEDFMPGERKSIRQSASEMEAALRRRF